MGKQTIKQNANNIMWVEYWIQQAHPSFKDYELFAEKYDEDRWVCEIKLPLINKTVKAISEKEVDAMLDASNKATILIDQYMKEHPELKIKNTFKNKRWEIISDEDGKFISIGMSSAWRKELGQEMQKMMEDSIEAVKEAIKKLAKINGSSKNLYIQVLDRSLFDDNMTANDIVIEMNDKLNKEYQIMPLTVCYGKEGNSVIVVGYTHSFAKKGDLK